jgi:hypothetical protein
LKPTIRAARPEDFGAILRMLVDMHAEVGEFALSVEKVSKRIDETLANGVVLIAEIDGQAIGTIGLRGEAPWYSDQHVIADTWIWAQGRRRLSAFRTTVEAAHDYAQRFDLPCIITLYSLKNTSRKTSLFERYGRRIMEGFQFKPAGGDFLTGMEG